MFVIGNFSYSTQLEIVLANIEEVGVGKSDIIVIPLQTMPKKEKIRDKLVHFDSESILDTAFILGAIFMVFGVIYGYKLTLGPIICGIIGFLIGFLIGFILDLIPKKKSENSKLTKVDKSTSNQCIIIVKCKNKQESEFVFNLMNENKPIGTAFF